jgi:sugar phosphate isomerase/epimerase
MKPIVAITAFNIDRYTTVEAFLEEYRVVGLETIELNGRVRQHVIDELVPYIERGEIRISSLHNFCPRPEVLDKVDLRLSSPDEEARRLAVAHTCNTIATAQRLGAKAVVLHAGEILPLRPLMARLKELGRAGQQGSAAFTRLKSELVDRRRREQDPYVKAAERSLVELCEFVARERVTVKLGLENRDYYNQIPQHPEYDAWFERYGDLPIYLWYDFGHGEILENLGLGDKRALLERHGSRLLGLHLHDCKGVQDHAIPGSGDVNFGVVKPYLHPGVLRVLEYGRRVQPVSRIAEGIRYLREREII